MNTPRTKVHFPGNESTGSWRLKLVGWLEIVIGAWSFLLLLQILVMTAIGLHDGPDLTFLLILAAMPLYGAARIYAGLLLLDRSRQAWVLLMLISSVGFCRALRAAPLISWGTLWSVGGIALVASIWNEVEGPFPFGLTARHSLLAGSLVCLLATAIPPLEPAQHDSAAEEARIAFVRARTGSPRLPSAPYKLWADLARDEVPGFAGLAISWVSRDDKNRECTLTLYLTDPVTQRGKALAYFASPAAKTASGVPVNCRQDTMLRVEQVKYDMNQLNTWYELLHQENWRLESSRPTTGSSAEISIDIRANIITVDIAIHDDAVRIRQFADSVGIPKSAVGWVFHGEPSSLNLN